MTPLINKKAYFVRLKLEFYEKFSLIQKISSALHLHFGRLIELTFWLTNWGLLGPKRRLDCVLMSFLSMKATRKITALLMLASILDKVSCIDESEHNCLYSWCSFNIETHLFCKVWTNLSWFRLLLFTSLRSSRKSGSNLHSKLRSWHKFSCLSIHMTSSICKKNSNNKKPSQLNKTLSFQNKSNKSEQASQFSKQRRQIKAGLSVFKTKTIL